MGCSGAHIGGAEPTCLCVQAAEAIPHPSEAVDLEGLSRFTASQMAWLGTFSKQQVRVRM